MIELRSGQELYMDVQKYNLLVTERNKLHAALTKISIITEDDYKGIAPCYKCKEAKAAADEALAS